MKKILKIFTSIILVATICSIGTTTFAAGIVTNPRPWVPVYKNEKDAAKAIGSTAIFTTAGSIGGPGGALTGLLGSGGYYLFNDAIDEKYTPVPVMYYPSRVVIPYAVKTAEETDANIKAVYKRVDRTIEGFIYKLMGYVIRN